MAQQGERAYLSILDDLTKVIALYVGTIAGAWESADAKAILERVQKNITALRAALNRGDDEEQAA